MMLRVHKQIISTTGHYPRTPQLVDRRSPSDGCVHTGYDRVVVTTPNIIIKVLFPIALSYQRDLFGEVDGTGSI